MDEKKKMSKKKKVLIGVGIYCVVAAIIFIIMVNSDSYKNATGTPQVAAQNVAEAAKPANERLQIAVAQAQKNNELNTGIEKILALYYSEDSCDVAVKINAYWNEDRIIADGCKFGLAVAQEVFTRCPEYDVLRLRFYTDMQDQFGNVSESDVFNYNVRREIFAKVNFENFSNMVIVDYNNMWPLAEEVHIAPGILSGLKKIKL